MKQNGFTLVELLVTLAISGLVTAAVLAIMFQVTVGSDRNNSQVSALVDANYAAFSIKKDLQMTQVTNLIDGNPMPQSSVNLTWTDYTSFEGTDNKTHNSSYVLSGTDLLRIYDGITGIAGRNITNVGFTLDDRVVDVTVTATGPGASKRSKTLEFTVQMRTEVAQ